MQAWRHRKLSQEAVSEHISNQRLAKIAGENSRLSETELAHLSGCSDCLAAYGRSILQVARATAKEKVHGSGAQNPWVTNSQ